MKLLKSKRMTLVLLLVIFMLPGLCAYWLYQHPNWLSPVTTNKGRLLVPPVLLSSLPKTSKWGVLLWNPGRCTAVCRQQLNKITRIRLALGRRFYEVNLWLVTDNSKTVRMSKTNNLLKKQGITPLVVQQAPNGLHESQVLIVDKDNYLILSYPLEANPADIYTDLQRVMNLQRSL